MTIQSSASAGDATARTMVDPPDVITFAPQKRAEAWTHFDLTITAEEAEQFAAILTRAFEATIACNPHRSYHKHLINHHRAGPEDEAAVAACEASGALWECLWWSSLCGFSDFIAPTWPALVRKVIAADADLVVVAP